MAESCGNPSSEQDALMLRRSKFDKSNICIKCKVNPGNVVIRHAVIASAECFFPLVSSKFRRALVPAINPGPIPDTPRKKKGSLKAAGNLCIGFSGGLGSSVLLDLVTESYFPSENGNTKGGSDHPRHHEKVWDHGTVCYVEICSALPGTRDRTEEVRALVSEYRHFEFLPLRIEDAFDEAWWAKVGGRGLESNMTVDLADEDLILSQSTTSDNSVAALHSYISSLPTQTAVPSAIQTLIRLLLLHTARSTGSSHLLLGTSLTSLSVSLISSISQGGGFVVREEAQEEWQPTVESKRTVRVNRPLRDIGMKECAMWAWWKGVHIPGKENYLGGKQGIGALTKNFIVGLERDYPSTVSTIARTCGKLAPKDSSDSSCILCGRPAQPGKPDLASPPPHLQNMTPQIPPVAPASQSSLTPRLCYACHTTLTSRSSRGSTASGNHINSTPLPVWVVSELDGVGHRKMGEKEMKESISEYLLE
ncbi:hypothetical protein FB45DRAFT_887313 [Roridomyces roridus]|uniref:Cytoplasmic tRNA 2-thiolation protein 2 n=1 Tax=Roridomyces roridus TaxID=1738132 RepID=A0AAD7G114_9AGAR|nr:hypothetical protein FB45DRAFT_887313 [Roridomyces roridus]